MEDDNLFSHLVVEACAMIFPPIGFLGSAANIAAPSTCATTWLVITTATPNYKEKSNNSESIHLPQPEWGKKKKELSAIPSAVHNHSTTHLKTKWKQTASRQKAICRRLLRCTGKPIISPLGSKAKFIIYLICKSKQHTQKSGKMHLSGWQLTSAGVIRPVKGCGTVHNQQCIPGEVKYNVLRNCSRS